MASVNETGEPASVADRDRAKAEFDAVVAAGIFAKAPSLAQLLEYVCARYFEGHAEQIKEYNIAVEALGRPPSFDPRKDSIVRVEAFRLRKRLKQYYEEQGAGHALRIVIPPGQYVPRFVSHVQPETAGSQVAVEPSPSQADVPMVSDAASQGVPVAPARRWARAATAGGVLVLGGLVAGFLYFPRSQPRTVTAVRAATLVGATDTEEIRILAGSSAARYVDHLGGIWTADQFYHGGSPFSTPSHTIFSTPDPELFRSRREGDFSYDIPVKPGVYEVHLYFAETLFGENNTAGGGESSRIFRVSINGKAALWPFDVISDAGASNVADEKVFKDISPAADGMVHLEFAGLVNNVPFLNALAILPGVPGRMRPVRIVALGRNYTDRRGQVWGADRYFSHGSTVPRTEPVVNTDDPEIFQAERFGNFGYVVPVPPGRYRVTLRFAETWFGPGQPGGGGDGSRVFDVFCNGESLLRGFDVFRAAGGHHRAVEKTFQGIAPNAQGKIALAFVPIVNYAAINAIEVTDESE